jgi:hypothetical protein
MRFVLTGGVGVMDDASRVAVAMMRLCHCGAGRGEQHGHQQRSTFHDA